MVPTSAQRGTNFKTETGEVFKISKEGDAAIWSMCSTVILKTFFLYSAVICLIATCGHCL